MPKTAKRARARRAKTPKYTWTYDTELRAYIAYRGVIKPAAFLNRIDELGQDWRIKRQSLLNKFYNFNFLNGRSPQLSNASTQCRQIWRKYKDMTDEQLRTVYDDFLKN